MLDSALADMIRIPGGTFRMGSDRHYPEEAPANRARSALLWTNSSAASVNVIARKCGFSQLGRFAVVYKAPFDETPSTTLRGRLRFAGMPDQAAAAVQISRRPQ